MLAGNIKFCIANFSTGIPFKIHFLIKSSFFFHKKSRRIRNSSRIIIRYKRTRYNTNVMRPNHGWQLYCHIWAPSSEFVSSSIPSWQILTAHAQPFRGARDLAFCLKVPLDSLLVWASSGGSGETARMRRLAWTFAARIGDKYQIRLTRSIWCLWSVPPGFSCWASVAPAFKCWSCCWVIILFHLGVESWFVWLLFWCIDE